MKRFLLFLTGLFLVACGAAIDNESLTPAATTVTGNEPVIIYKRSGGIAGIEETWWIYENGRIENNEGAVHQADPAEVEAIQELMQEQDFLRMDERYLPENTCCDRFFYEITLRAGNQSHTVRTMDGTESAPDGLDAIIRQLGRLITRAMPTPTLLPTTATTVSMATPPPETGTPTPSPLPPTATPSANDLLEAVRATMPDDAYNNFDEGNLNAFPLETAVGPEPLWVVHSAGMRNYDTNSSTPPPAHFVAIYAHRNGAWQELAHKNLAEGENIWLSPDFLAATGVTPVPLSSNRIWLTVEGGVGAHGGAFQLLSFDGDNLTIEVASSNASPGVGFVQDVNDDGAPEVVLRQHNYYVFCYACAVRYLSFQVFTWDEENHRLREVGMEPLPANHPAHDPANRAVELAQADLWPDALAKILEAQQIATGDGANNTLNWNTALIRFTHDAWQEEIGRSPYPLLTNIFYGDFAAALNMMRAYSPDQIFSPATPLLADTVAEGWETTMADYILDQTNAALSVQPDLAAAYYLRAWATYLKNPGDSQIQEDLARAGELAPNDPLLAQTSAPPTPQRIQFAPGAISATVQGEVAAHESDDYILRALAEQTMTVTINSPTDNVLLTIVGADGIPLTNGLMSGATTWSGELPATQDYTIRAIGTFDATSYTLTVTIK